MMASPDTSTDAKSAFQLVGSSIETSHREAFQFENVESTNLASCKAVVPLLEFGKADNDNGKVQQKLGMADDFGSHKV
jgi:hypothetical protein